MNEWILYEKYILRPLEEEIKKTGLDRASQYRKVSYEELLDIYQVGDLVTDISHPYLQQRISDLKAGEYIVPKNISVITGEEILGGTTFEHEPQRDLKTGKKSSIPIVAGQMFSAFAQLDSKISSDKSVEENLLVLKELSTKGVDGDKLLKWVNTYGLLFSSPVSQTQDLTHFLRNEIELYDFLYYLIRLEYRGTLPYFMSVKLLEKFSIYSAWLLAGTWFYKRYHGEFCGENVNEVSKAEYKQFCVEFAKEVEAASLLPDLSPEMSEVIRINVEDHFKAMLANNLSHWIGYQIKEGWDFDKGGEVKFATRFSSQSLMGAMALGQYSLLVNQNANYRKCLNPRCLKTFEANTKRAGAVYCDSTCRVAAYRIRKQNIISMKIN